MAQPPPLPLQGAALRRGPAAGLELQQLLLAREVAVNSCSDPHGISALHVAAMLRRADLCSMLLVAGALHPRCRVCNLCSFMHRAHYWRAGGGTALILHAT